MQLVADPSTLSLEQLYEATITITSSDSSIVNQERVRVGLWVGSSMLSSPITLVGDHKYLVADAIRPYLYTHGNVDGEIRVLHFHTGVQIASIMVPAARLGAMTVSSDGSELYVLDWNANVMHVVDLTTRTVVRTFATVNSGAAFIGIRYIRVNAVGLITGAGHYIAATGELKSNGFLNGRATRDGRYSFGGIGRYVLDYTDANGGHLFSELDPTQDSSNYAGAPVYGGHVAVNLDGSLVAYNSSPLSSFGSPCHLMNGLTTTSIAPMGVGRGPSSGNWSYGASVAMSVNNDVLCMSRDQMGAQDDDNAWLYSASGELRQSFMLYPSTEGSIQTPDPAAFSSDGFVAAVTTASSFGMYGISRPGVSLHILPVYP
jgi:hypothetical protein